MPQRPIVIAALAGLLAAVTVAVAIAVVVTRGDGGDGDGQDYQPQIREALLEDVHANPACPDAGEEPALDEGQVRVNVVRVVDGCLAYSSEAVAAPDVDKRLKELRADENVVAADRAVERQPSVDATRQAASAVAPAQWALEPEHLDGAGVRELWPAEATDVKVAIIDTGIDPEHQDLAAQTADRAPWYHRYKGDYDSHGTHVGGIVAAADDGAGVVGLTPGARLIDVQYYDGSGDLAGPSNDLGEYVRWAVDHGADVINMSIQGKEPSDTELTAVLYAEREGVVVIGAVGNCGRFEPPSLPWDNDPKICDDRHELKWPAAYPTVLSVAAHNEDNERAGFSSANSTVDVSAPGEDILSDCLTEDGDDRVTCEASGTSQATPYVSATAALLKARHPDATPQAIRDAITKSARTDSRQPVDSRTDEFGWGILDPEAAAQYLDEHPGAPQRSGSASADRTVAAYLNWDLHQMFVLDDGIPHPVRPIPEDDTVRSVDWSADHTRLVAAANGAIFTWNGPGSTLVEAPCEKCDVADLDLPTGDVVAALDGDGTVTSYDPATLQPTGTAKIALADAGQGFVLYGDVSGKLIVAHSITPEASGPDTLWLVDPATGEASSSYGGDDTLGIAPVAVDAAGEQVANVSEWQSETCGGTYEVNLLSGDDLSPIVTAEMPTSSLGALEPEDIFFNGGVLYAVMTAWGPDGDSDCTEVASAGIWRLDDSTGEWDQVSADPVAALRPIEGLTENPGGALAVAYDGSQGTFVPTGSRGDEHVQLGELSTVLWATPTVEEVDLGRESSTPPVDEPEDPDPNEPAPNTTEAAVARFEDYLHALGEGDIDTICEIAGPGAQQAEEEGFGPCEETFGVVLDMISPEQADALKTAHVNLALVESTGPGQVYIPVEAVDANVAFTENDLGSYTIAYQNNNWFIID